MPSKLRINGWRMCIQHTLPTIQLFKKLSVVRGMYKFEVPVYCSVMLHYQNTLGVEIHTDMWPEVTADINHSLAIDTCTPQTA